MSNVKLRDCRGIAEAVNEACTCGGGGPDDGCPACKVFHAIRDMEFDDGAVLAELRGDASLTRYARICPDWFAPNQQASAANAVDYAAGGLKLLNRTTEKPRGDVGDFIVAVTLAARAVKP